MAKQINQLTARSVQTLKKPGRHPDGRGLYLKIRPSGSKAWVFVYDFEKKRREMGLGPVDVVSLAEARAKVSDLRANLQNGVDPMAKAEREAKSTVLFKDVATSLIETLKPSWKNAKHAQQWTNTLTTHAASIWDMPVASITTEHMTALLMPIWSEIPETASRVRARIERVLDAAKVHGYRDGDNPARWRGHLEVLLPKRKLTKRKHHPAMPYEQVPDFIVDLRRRPALSARALEFTILTAARTSEVLKATWDEFDLEKKLWTVPAKRMKMEVDHRVPLVDRAVALLEHAKFMGGKGPFIASNMAMDMLLRRMDQNDYTVHGFRSSFRDWVGEETDFPREIAEAALAHQVGNEVERAYRRGDALKKRRELMEAWAAYVTPPAAPQGTAQDRPAE